MAFSAAVRLILKGKGLHRFLTAASDGLRGLRLYNKLRQILKGQGLSQKELSQIFRVYSETSAASSPCTEMLEGGEHLLKDIPVNAHLEVFDPVLSRVAYQVRVRGGLVGEESIHERIIQVESPHPLTLREIGEQLDEEFQHLFYAESGQLAADTGGITHFTMDCLGVSRIY